MLMLSHAFIREHPEALQYHKLKQFSHADIVLRNRNGLILQDPSVDGLKTGHVEEAGYHLIATAQRDSRRYIAVIMGAETIEVREKETMQLLDFGFNDFVTVRLFNKGEILSQLSILKGSKGRVGLVPHIDGVVTIPIDQSENVSVDITSHDQQEAPIQLNQKLGEAIISYQKNALKTVALFADEEIQRAGFIQVALQTIEIVIFKYKISLIVIIVLIGICGLQTWYIKRLRSQHKDRYENEHLVKERLNKLLKPNKDG
jgi:D-alanyl-D-alanine carboxypeptidase (penicillin-binding protein 5/6)